MQAVMQPWLETKLFARSNLCFTRNQIVFPPFAKSKVAENPFTISFATFFPKAADAKIFSQQTEAVLNEAKQELELVSEITRCIDGGSSTSAAA
jgi:hypothetical protein